MEVRVKFELGDEKRCVCVCDVMHSMLVRVHNVHVSFCRVIHMSRPLTLEALQEQTQRIFPGNKFTMYYFDTEVRA